MAASSLWVFIGCLLLLHMFLIRSPSRQDVVKAEEWIMRSPPSRVSVLGGFFKEKHPRALTSIFISSEQMCSWDARSVWEDGKCV